MEKLKNKNNGLLQFDSVNKIKRNVLCAMGHFYLGVTFWDMPLQLYYDLTGGRAFFLDLYAGIKYLVTLPF